MTAQIRINPDTWSQRRFSQLCAQLGQGREQMLGTLVMLWARSRAANLDVAMRHEVESLLPVESDMRASTFNALLKYGYVRGCDAEGFVIEGNEAYFASIAQKRAAGRIGAVKRWHVQGKTQSARALFLVPAPKNQAIVTEDAQRARHAFWLRYVKAYRDRYKVSPVRNGKTNTEVAKIVSRIGAADAPALAAFYVKHHDLEYIRHNHNLRLAVRDAESLYAQWRRGEVLGADTAPGTYRPMRQASLWQG